MTPADVDLNADNACVALLDRNLEAGRGDKIVFTDPYRTITYRALADETKRCARALLRLGLRREDRIVMAMLDTIDFPIVFFGALRAGIIPIPVNTLMPAASYRYMLADSRAKALVVSADILAAVAPALEGLEDLQHVIVSCADVASPHLSFSALLAAEPPDFETVPTQADEIGFWYYSSGSTGAPKGTRHVHSNLVTVATHYGQQVLGIQESDVCFSAAKLFFAYGFGNAVVFPMSVGASSILSPVRPTPALMFKLLAQHNPTLFYAVPTLYAAMLGDPALAQEKGSSRLRRSVSAGEALPEHIGHAWQKRFGSELLDGVGSTEMLHIFLSNAPGDVAYGTSGRAVPGYDLRLVNDAGVEASGDEVGELYVRGPSAADGYWNQRAKSRATFQGEWTRTGDKYTRDASGRYTYCGRADDMFKVSGIWVSPFEIEAALSSHPAVLEAAVVAAPDADGLLKPKAFVILKPGASSEDLREALKDHVKKTAGAWKYPRWIEIVDSLPKTATGKIQRFKLRDPA